MCKDSVHAGRKICRFETKVNLFFFFIFANNETAGKNKALLLLYIKEPKKSL